MRISADHVLQWSDAIVPLGELSAKGGLMGNSLYEKSTPIDTCVSISPILGAIALDQQSALDLRDSSDKVLLSPQL